MHKKTLTEPEYNEAHHHITPSINIDEQSLVKKCFQLIPSKYSALQ